MTGLGGAARGGRDIRPRLATPDDRPGIEGIVEESYSPYIERMGQKPGPMLDDYAELIREGRVHVLERDGETRAYVVLLPLPDAMLLDNVAVAASSRGQGLGKILLAFAEEKAREAGYRLIKLYTHETMTENISIYLRAGYRETRRAEEKGFRRVFMEKALD